MSIRENPAQRLALAGMAASALLAIAKIWIGMNANSTSAVADGLESAADVFSSGIVFLGLWIAQRPADENHPYGHGRFEILAALAVGIILVLAGVSISVRSLGRIGRDTLVPASYAMWPLLISLGVKLYMSFLKMRQGRKMDSAALMADAKNDGVDVISSAIALVALGLTLYDPVNLLEADHVGGAIVGMIVCVLGFTVIRDTVYQLTDAMPDSSRLEEVRLVAMAVDGVEAVEKCYARKTGMRYHVDLHLEVDPNMTVRASHAISGRVRDALKRQVPWVADVLIHVEPYDAVPGQGLRQ